MVRAVRTAALVAVVVAVASVGAPMLTAEESGGADRPPSTHRAQVADRRAALVHRANRGGPRSLPTTTTTASMDTAPGWEQRRGEAALDLLDYPWQDIGYRIEFLPARAGYLGLTWPEERRIQIFVRPEASVAELARDAAHELGHAIDWTRNDEGRREEYRRVRGISQSGWFTCHACTDLATPAGDFAETFSYWLLEGQFPSRSRIGTPLDDGQMAHLGSLFTMLTA